VAHARRVKNEVAKMKTMYDTIIIGSGPAGLTAAIYAQRANLRFAVLEKNSFSGGQMIYANEIENYPAIHAVSGLDLGMKMRRQAENLGARFIQTEVKRLRPLSRDHWQVVTEQDVLETKTVIYAAGAEHKTLNVPGETKYRGRGVSYCATCDGGFYKGKATAVIGGGNTALQDALYLAKFCEKVYLVHRRDGFRAFQNTVERVRESKKIELVLDSELEEILGGKKVEEIAVRNKNQAMRYIEVNGVFIAVGVRAVNDLVRDFVEKDAGGFIVTDADCCTKTPGLYAAGDVRSKKYRQIVTAAADGAIAAETVSAYLG